MHDASSPQPSPDPPRDNNNRNGPPWRSIAYYLFCALLAVIAGTLLYMTWQRAQQLDTPATPSTNGGYSAPMTPGPATQPGSASATQPDQQTQQADLMSLLQRDATGAEAQVPMQWLDPNAAPLDREPADLPAPPGGERQWRFKREIAGQVEAVAAWRVRGASLDELSAFYREAAQQRGFTPIEREPVEREATERDPAPAPSTQPQTRRLSFVTREAAGDAPSRMLTIRLSRRSTGSVHVLIALRYAMSPQ